MSGILLVGLGGAFGAIARYAISLLPVKSTFPILTLLINFIGAVLIGFIAGMQQNKQIRENWSLFWRMGVCGGFTTFSTFSIETLTLFQSERYIYGGVYIVFSIVLCLAGVLLGQYTARRLFGA